MNDKPDETFEEYIKTAKLADGTFVKDLKCGQKVYSASPPGKEGTISDICFNWGCRQFYLKFDNGKAARADFWQTTAPMSDGESLFNNRKIYGIISGDWNNLNDVQKAAWEHTAKNLIEWAKERIK